ncbi:MAG: hypothetical protein JWR69_1970 [Pedosphaera sp.]|nr:hypothetical protein [Pedosphaera sp.]
MGVSLQAEFARPQLAPQQNRRSHTDNPERNCLLPIHGSKIPPFPGGATTSFLLFTNVTLLINLNYTCLTRAKHRFPRLAATLPSP